MRLRLWRGGIKDGEYCKSWNILCLWVGDQVEGKGDFGMGSIFNVEKLATRETPTGEQMFPDYSCVLVSRTSSSDSDTCLISL